MRSFANFLVKLLILVLCIDVLAYVGWGIIPVVLLMYAGYKLFTYGGKKLNHYRKESEAWNEFKRDRGL